MEQLSRIELRGIVGNVRVQNLNDRKVCHFTLATSRAYKGKNGVAVIETTWHSIVAWENEAVDLSKIEKGSKLYVTGRLRSQKYVASDASERVIFEVVANRIVFVDSDEPLACEL